MIKHYVNGRLLVEGEIVEGSILLSKDSIEKVYKKDETPEQTPELVVDLSGKVIFPALINSHDHLYNTFWPRWGAGKFQNWYEWEDEFKSSEIFRQKQLLSVADLYALGMYRNLLSGVGLVVDHFPQEISANFAGKPLIGLLENFCIAHSFSSRGLDWGEGIEEELKKSKNLLPFIIHAGEGFDSEITHEIESLNRMGALGENTVLVLGPGVSESDLDLIASKKSSVVWVAQSNQFVFGKAIPVEKILNSEIKMCIGTDNALTGGINMLEEMRFIRKLSRETLGSRLQAKEIIAMATRTAGEIFRIEKFGKIAPGAFANLVAFDDTGKDPFDAFLDLTPKGVSLVVHKGMLVYGDEKFRNYCSADFSQFSEITVDGIPKIIWGKPLNLLDRIENKLGEPVKFPFLPIAEG